MNLTSASWKSLVEVQVTQEASTAICFSATIGETNLFSECVMLNWYDWFGLWGLLRLESSRCTSYFSFPNPVFLPTTVSVFGKGSSQYQGFCTTILKLYWVGICKHSYPPVPWVNLASNLAVSVIFVLNCLYPGERSRWPVNISAVQHELNKVFCGFSQTVGVDNICLAWRQCPLCNYVELEQPWRAD